MKLILSLCLCCFFCLSHGNGLVFVRDTYDSANVKHPYGIYGSIGGSYSSVDIYSNYLTNPRRIGINPRLYGEFSNVFRLAAGYSLVPKFTYEPSWSKLKGEIFELDLHTMARIKQEYSIVYLITGFCYDRWSGYYKQKSLFYDATKDFVPNTTISQGWAGLNLGLGIERAFKYFEIFGEYKYRFNKTKENIGIADISINIGVKKKIRFGKIFKGLTDKYHWF